MRLALLIARRTVVSLDYSLSMSGSRAIVSFLLYVAAPCGEQECVPSGRQAFGGRPARNMPRSVGCHVGVNNFCLIDDAPHRRRRCDRPPGRSVFVLSGRRTVTPLVMLRSSLENLGESNPRGIQNLPGIRRTGRMRSLPCRYRHIVP